MINFTELELTFNIVEQYEHNGALKVECEKLHFSECKELAKKIERHLTDDKVTFTVGDILRFSDRELLSALTSTAESAIYFKAKSLAIEENEIWRNIAELECDIFLDQGPSFSVSKDSIEENMDLLSNLESNCFLSEKQKQQKETVVAKLQTIIDRI